MDKHLFHRRSGLCNRIRGLISLWRAGTEFSVYEQKTALFPGQFSDFLDNPINHHDKPEGFVIPWRLLVTEKEVPISFAKASSMKKSPSIDLEYDRIPQNIRDLFLPYFAKLMWKPEIVKEVDVFGLKDQVSVHIREDYDWTVSGRTTSLEHYFDEIDKHVEDKMYFIVHTKAIEDAVRQRYGTKVIIYPNKSYETRHPSDLIGWVKDLLVMSKSRLTVGHWQSSFDDTAWWLGGCKSSVHQIH
jgi:hypothetical protein